jgi:putative Holliday junction resolvase
MRVLALDIGEKRIGIAVSDPSGTVASPVSVLDAAAVLSGGRDLLRLIEDYEAELIVIGLPRSMDGSEGPQAARVRAAGDRLARLLPIPITYADERLSSVEARRTLTEAGMSDRQKRGTIDMVAASIFLQTYLDAARGRDAARDES